MPSPRKTTETDTPADDTSAAAATDTAPEPQADDSQDAPYYCPGCGMRYEYRQQCTGRPESPHPPIEVVETGELSGDPENHTPAPNTDNLG